jgi:hypothetical protein
MRTSRDAPQIRRLCEIRLNNLLPTARRRFTTAHSKQHEGQITDPPPSGRQAGTAGNAPASGRFYKYERSCCCDGRARARL